MCRTKGKKSLESVCPSRASPSYNHWKEFPGPPRAEQTKVKPVAFRRSPVDPIDTEPSGDTADTRYIRVSALCEYMYVHVHTANVYSS